MSTSLEQVNSPLSFPKRPSLEGSGLPQSRSKLAEFFFISGKALINQGLCLRDTAARRCVKEDVKKICSTIFMISVNERMQAEYQDKKLRIEIYEPGLTENRCRLRADHKFEKGKKGKRKKPDFNRPKPKGRGRRKRRL